MQLHLFFSIFFIKFLISRELYEQSVCLYECVYSYALKNHILSYYFFLIKISQNFHFQLTEKLYIQKQNI